MYPKLLFFRKRIYYICLLYSKYSFMLNQKHKKKSYFIQRISRPALFLTVLFGLACLLPAIASAQGNLLITPQRLVFDGKKRNLQMTLANNGLEAATYNISFKEYIMNEDGSFREVTEPEPGQNFASDHLRFFPRSVTLPPGDSQIVKIQLSSTKKLEEGEYRSHIYFRGVPNAKPMGEEEEIDTTAVTIQLIPVFGITVPVIFRVGETSAEVNIKELALNMVENKPNLQMLITRTGNQSVYGDIKVNHVAPDGTVSRAGIVRGMAVYTPNKKRPFSFELMNKDLDYSSGKLIVKYISVSDLKTYTLAESELLLQ
jgi:hypothetical protein